MMWLHLISYDWIKIDGQQSRPITEIRIADSVSMFYLLLLLLWQGKTYNQLKYKSEEMVVTEVQGTLVCKLLHWIADVTHSPPSNYYKLKNFFYSISTKKTMQHRISSLEIEQ